MATRIIEQLSPDLLEEVFSPEHRIGKLLASLDDLPIPQIAQADENMRSAFNSFKSEIRNRIKSSVPMTEKEFEERLRYGAVNQGMYPADFANCLSEIFSLKRFLFPSAVRDFIARDSGGDYHPPKRLTQDLTLLLLPQFKSPWFQDLSRRIISALECRGAKVEYEPSPMGGGFSPLGDGYSAATITLNPDNPWMVPSTMVLRRPWYEMGRVTHQSIRIESNYAEEYRPVLDALTRSSSIRPAHLHACNRFSELLEPELTGRGPVAKVIEDAVARLVQEHGFDLSGLIRLASRLDLETQMVVLGETSGHDLEDEKDQIIRLSLYSDQRNSQGEVEIFSLVMSEFIPRLSANAISGGYFTFTLLDGQIHHTAETGNVHRHLTLMGRLERDNPYGVHLSDFVRKTLKAIP